MVKFDTKQKRAFVEMKSCLDYEWWKSNQQKRKTIKLPFGFFIGDRRSDFVFNNTNNKRKD